MAQRRMFSLKIVSSDAFLDMPLSTQALYFHLGMYSDDDGFVNPKKIMRMIGSSSDDLKLLIAKRFVLTFENGVIVIKHWKINNLIRKDFYQETVYINQKKSLTFNKNKAYTENVNNLSPQVRLDKVSIVNKRGAFTPPSLEEIKNYCQERKNTINPQNFIDFYQSKGWMVGKNKMKDWKACVRTWESRSQDEIKKADTGPTYRTVDELMADHGIKE